MSRGYVYLEYEGEENLRLFLTLMGRLLRDKVQSEPKGNGRVLVTLEDAQNSLPVFEASFDALCVDNPGIAKALIIPSPSPCFFEGLELLGPKELDSYAHLCLTHLELLDGAMALLDPLSPEEIEAAYAYIKCGQSPSAAGLGISAHKNTVCNRVKRFVGKTGIDLSLFSNQLFVYLLGNEWKKTLQRG